MIVIVTVDRWMVADVLRFLMTVFVCIIDCVNTFTIGLGVAIFAMYIYICMYIYMHGISSGDVFDGTNDIVVKTVLQNQISIFFIVKRHNFFTTTDF